MKKWDAWSNWVLVEPIVEVDKTTKDGLLLTDEDLQDVRTERGTVHSVGPLCVQPFEVGDEVQYYKTDGNAVQLDDGEIYKIVNEGAIFLLRR